MLARRLGRHKVQVARRIARRADDVFAVEALVGDVADDHTARLITDRGFVFLAEDTMLVRDVVNQIASPFLDRGKRRQRATRSSMSLMAWLLSRYSSAWMPAWRAPST